MLIIRPPILAAINELLCLHPWRRLQYKMLTSVICNDFAKKINIQIWSTANEIFESGKFLWTHEKSIFMKMCIPHRVFGNPLPSILNKYETEKYQRKWITKKTNVDKINVLIECKKINFFMCSLEFCGFKKRHPQRTTSKCFSFAKSSMKRSFLCSLFVAKSIDKAIG